MAPNKITVGIVGANPTHGWAARAHLPVLSALPDYEISAVATRHLDSATATASRFGIPHAFADPRQLAEHPDVDVVVITVKVPFHAELVGIALDAGKHVYCEWPLALGVDQAELLLARAEQAGVHHVTGLQARYSPGIAYARDLIAQGRLGRVVSATVHSTIGRMGRAPADSSALHEIPEQAVSIVDRASGAGTLEIVGGHTLDAVQSLLGAITTVSASTSVQHPEYRVAETGDTVAATTPDHLVLHGSFAGGAVLSAHVHGAKNAEAGTRIEINGTRGDLLLLSHGPHRSWGIQLAQLRVSASNSADGTYTELTVPERFRRTTAVDESAEGFNQAQLYTQLAHDLRDGVHTVPDFAAAVDLHRLLEAASRSAQTGARQTLVPSSQDERAVAR